jgi:hypothetical protein
VRLLSAMLAQEYTTCQAQSSHEPCLRRACEGHADDAVHCRNDNVGTDNDNRNRDGLNHVVSNIAYAGSSNNNGKQCLLATCLPYNNLSSVKRPPEL